MNTQTNTHYLVVDPGSKRSGVAWFDADGDVQGMQVLKGEDELLDWLEEQTCEVFIYENYRTRPGTTHSNWSSNETSQVIGAMLRVARKKGWVTKKQEPSPCLAIGLKYLGMGSTYKGKHVPDQISALAHGEYYLVKNKVKVHRIARD